MKVAKIAGVSHMTVSRVINHQPRVAEATRKRVLEVMKELGYVPPPKEKRKLKAPKRKDGVRTGFVALLFPDTESRAMRTPISGLLAQGIEEVLHNHEVNLIVSNLRKPDQLPPGINPRKLDGVIIRGGKLSSFALSALSELPCVWLNMDLPSKLLADEVRPDHETIGTLAAEALLKMGCRRIGTTDQSDALDSPAPHLIRAFVKRIRQENLEPIFDTPDNKDVLRSGCDGLMTHAVTGQDLSRFQSRLASAGLKPGRDLKIVVADRAHFTRQQEFKADVIDSNMEHVGRTAAETILWRLRNPTSPRRRILVEPTYIPQ